MDKKRWQRLLENTGTQAALVLSPSNRFYFSGFESSAGALLITTEMPYLIVDFRYHTAASANTEGFLPVMSERSNLITAGELAARHGIKSLAYEEDFVTISAFDALRKAFPDAELMRASKHMAAMRMQKDEREIRSIRAAQELADKTFSHVLGLIRPGMTERELALETEYYMRKIGAQKPAFDTIAVSGPNTAKPHGVATGRAIQNGDFVTLDFGCMVDGYRSDMTRTVAVGYADERMKSVYQTVLDAQLAALAGIRAGMNGAEADALARDLIEKAGYAGCFGHGLGHGVGIDIHEEPRFSPFYNDPVGKNTVMTVEPGIYIKDEFGVRIEDMVVLTDDGYENLTRSPKELIII